METRVLRFFAIVSTFALAACGDGDGSNDQASQTDPIARVATDATMALSGLPAAATMVVDDVGIPHVYAPDLESAIFIQGYETAKARFWQMDVFRRFAEGRLSEIFGRATLETDVQMRTVVTTRDGRRLEEAFWQHVQQVDAEVTRVLEAYAAGVNAWLADLRAGRNGARLPPEYELDFIIDLTAEDLAPWRPQDSLAIARLQAWSLSETMAAEIGFARRIQSLPEAIVRDVFRSAPAAPATVLPPTTGRGRGAASLTTEIPVELPQADTLAAIVHALQETQRWNPLGHEALGLGSNNWIVAPSLSASGHAMLANDPHLALFNPPIWHMLQLQYGATEQDRRMVNGVIFPGLPGVILGHNDFGAWGGTVAVFDVTDVYIETITTPTDYPASPRTVLFKGRQVPVLRIEETFYPKGFAPVTQVIEVVPHHGPMVPDPNIRDGVVGLAASGMSFRWTGHEMTNDPRFLLDLNRARNVAEFRAALQNFAVGAQNWVWADVHGDIAYFPHALVPQRPPGVVPYLPVSGSGDAEWLTDAEGRTAWLPQERIPQATNPPQGFLATANNDQIGNTLDNDPLNDDIYLTFTASLGFRAQRIQELLSNQTGVRPPGARITLADMSRYQRDTSSKEAARLLPFLYAAAAARPDLVTAEMAGALARLRAWGAPRDGGMPFAMAAGVDAASLRDDVPTRPEAVTDEERDDAVAASLFTAWLTRLVPAVLADDFAGSGIGNPGGEDATKALLHLLEDVGRTDAGFRIHTAGPSGESTLWDNRTTAEVETRDEILLQALNRGLSFLAERFSSNEPTDWLWGRIHQVRFTHFIGQTGIGSFDLGPFAAPGGRFTVNPADYSTNASSFTFSGGPSMRFVAVLDPAGIRAVNSLPGGNNGDPGGSGSERFGRINPEIHYGDLIPDWINGQTFDLRISRADVAAHAQRKVQYVR
jgi:penicillin amidase